MKIEPIFPLAPYTFLKAFGREAGECISPKFAKTVFEHHFNLLRLTRQDRDDILLNVLKRIKVDTQIIASEEREGDWERGWRENFDAYSQSKSPSALTPRFMRQGLPIRWQGEFYRTLKIRTLRFTQIERQLAWCP